ncbi:MAG: hypothetical protein IJ560_01720 [Alphaproteobacteria bacterium]|nr:hypothetical protein [Alphaproteobacteria bacterium]
MLGGIRIYTSDVVWRQILGDLGATVVDLPADSDVDFDTIKLNDKISGIELKAKILGAMDNTGIMKKIFGHDMILPPAQEKIIARLYNGGANMAELKVALGYDACVATHAVDTAIYQLRKTFGHQFIINNGGIYTIGKL